MISNSQFNKHHLKMGWKIVGSLVCNWTMSFYMDLWFCNIMLVCYFAVDLLKWEWCWVLNKVHLSITHEVLLTEMHILWTEFDFSYIDVKLSSQFHSVILNPAAIFKIFTQNQLIKFVLIITNIVNNPNIMPLQ